LKHRARETSCLHGQRASSPPCRREEDVPVSRKAARRRGASCSSCEAGQVRSAAALEVPVPDLLVHRFSLYRGWPG
jgi:hypothetical protein